RRRPGPERAPTGDRPAGEARAGLPGTLEVTRRRRQGGRRVPRGLRGRAAGGRGWAFLRREAPGRRGPLTGGRLTQRVDARGGRGDRARAARALRAAPVRPGQGV